MSTIINLLDAVRALSGGQSSRVTFWSDDARRAIVAAGGREIATTYVYEYEGGEPPITIESAGLRDGEVEIEALSSRPATANEVERARATGKPGRSLCYIAARGEL